MADNTQPAPPLVFQIEDGRPETLPIHFRVECSDGDFNVMAGRDGRFFDLFYVSRLSGALRRFGLSSQAREVLIGLAFDSDGALVIGE